jgi:hypothetical protein
MRIPYRLNTNVSLSFTMYRRTRVYARVGIYDEGNKCADKRIQIKQTKYVYVCARAQYTAAVLTS